MPWFGEEGPHQAHQLLGSDGLAALHAAISGDLAHGFGRNAAGQNDSGNLTTARFAQTTDGLWAGHAAWQAVVGNDDIRADRSLCQPQRLVAIRGVGGAIALACKQEIEHLAYRRIVFDNENCSVTVR